MNDKEQKKCGHCGSELREDARSSQKFCDAHCRRQHFDLQQRTGKVRYVRRIASGLMSVTYHIPETSRKPGDTIVEEAE